MEPPGVPLDGSLSNMQPLVAHANTVEDTVRQKQVSLLRQRQEAAVARELLTDSSPKSKPGLLFQQAPDRAPPLLMRLAALSIHGELPLEPRSNLYRRACLGTDTFLAP